ncbi:MAG: deoxyribonuclease IV [Bacilli bacterium]|nr:deoxyribonuclease IV [Bacilli bacterium]
MGKILLGSHVSMNGPKFYLGSVEEALSYGSTTFMFYTGAPQNSFRKPINELKIQEGRKLLKDAGIDENKIIVHAPYIVNGANKTKPELFQMSIDIITNELRRTAAFHCKTLVLHPGAHVGQGSEEGIKNLAECLDRVFENDGTDVKIALETMSGKGSEIGINFNEIKKIIDLCKYKNRLGVCLDTCHISDAGYDITDFDNILNEFDKIIGLDKLLVIHLNDSKNPKGAHKDRHENLGYGEIGFEILHKIAANPRLIDVPKILETPYINEKPPYKQEISMLQSGQYINNWKENF